MEAGILIENRHATDAAGSCDEITSGILKRPIRDGEIRNENGSTGSLLHHKEAIGDPDSSTEPTGPT